MCGRLRAAGFELGTTGTVPPLMVESWQIIILGLGVVVGLLLLVKIIVPLPFWSLLLAVAAAGFGLTAALLVGQALLLQKTLALFAALVFPSQAVISVFLKSGGEKPPSFLKTMIVIRNILLETSAGIILMLGLLADYRFISGIETFPAVKIALTLPIIMVAGVLYLKMLEGSWRERIRETLETQVSLLQVTH